MREAARTGRAEIKDGADVVRRSAVAAAWGELSLGRAEPPAVRPAERGGPAADFGAARFRDWNPDVRAARDVGGTIYYSSHDNAVHCASCRAVLYRDAGASSSPSGGSAGTSDQGAASSTSASASASSAGAHAAGHDAGGTSGAVRRDN